MYPKVRIFAFLKHIDLFGHVQTLHTIANIVVHTTIHPLYMIKFVERSVYMERIDAPLNILKT